MCLLIPRSGLTIDLPLKHYSLQNAHFVEGRTNTCNRIRPLQRKAPQSICSRIITQHLRG